MKDNETYVVVLPNGQEYFCQTSDVIHIRTNVREDLARQAVRASSLTTPRSNPEAVTVKMYILQITKGAMRRVLVGSYEVMPSLSRMTDLEFNAAMAVICLPLPEEFHGFVSQEASERGHAAGMEEVVSIAQELATSLQPHVEAYTRRLQPPKVDPQGRLKAGE